MLSMLWTQFTIIPLVLSIICGVSFIQNISNPQSYISALMSIGFAFITYRLSKNIRISDDHLVQESIKE